jgi:hypothetical protein
MSPLLSSGVCRVGGRGLDRLALSAVLALLCLACAVYDEHAVEATSQTAAAASSTVVEQAPAEMAAATVTMAEAPPPACVPLTEVDPCLALPHMAAKPEIDGELECGLTLHDWPLTAAAAQAHVVYAAAWSEAGFYVFIQVHAPASPPRPEAEPLYCGDALEIFVDSDGEPGASGRYNAPGTMQFVVAAPQAGDSRPSTGRFLAGLSQGPWISSNLNVMPLEDGYQLEALIEGPDLGLWSWHPNVKLGFNLAVNLAGAGELRGMPCTTGVGQSVLQLAAEMPAENCDGKPWCDSRSFCLPGLGQ